MRAWPGWRPRETGGSTASSLGGCAELETDSLSFVPSWVEGIDGVSKVTVFLDRLEITANGERRIVHFDEIAEWPRPRWLWKTVSRCGWRPGWLPIGERDWFHPPAQRFFRFFTTPRLTIYLPDDHEDYECSLFRRVQDVLFKGGYNTDGLG